MRPTLARTDTSLVEGDGLVGGANGDRQGGPSALRRLPSAPRRPDEPPPSVRLYREFKGLTVGDVLRAETAAALPGQLRKAVRRLEEGDLAGALEELPGRFAEVLPGPGRARRVRRRLFAALLFAAIVVLLLAAAIVGGPA